jgi:chromosome partitioning protein
MSILCVANQKGGVGKTTTAVNLAAGLARRGSRVLLVDLDLQGSATATLAGQLDADTPSLASCLVGGRPVADVVRPTGVPGLDLAPAGEALATVDLHLATALAREHVLSRLLAPVAAAYDHLVVDTAPYLGLLTLNALVAAEHILVPVSCEYLPILGLRLFGETLARIRASLGVPCHVLGYLLTLYDRRVERSSGRGRADYEALVDEVLARLEESRADGGIPRAPHPRASQPARERLAHAS